MGRIDVEIPRAPPRGKGGRKVAAHGANFQAGIVSSCNQIASRGVTGWLAPERLFSPWPPPRKQAQLLCNLKHRKAPPRKTPTGLAACNGGTKRDLACSSIGACTACSAATNG